MQLESQLRSVWDVRTAMLSDLSSAVARAETAHCGGSSSKSINDEPWELRLPVMSARAEMLRLLPTPVPAQLCLRLRDFVVDMMEKVQRPLPVRPRGTRDQRLRVLSDLRELLAACNNQPMQLQTAWTQLPCALWSETYVELVDSVNADQPKRHANEAAPTPSAKRIK